MKKLPAMRFGFLTLAILFSSAVLQSFFPWWTLVLIAFAGGYFVPLRLRTHSFWAGFFAGFLLWSVYALYLNMANEGLLATKIGHLLGGIPASLLPLLSGLFAGILSGMGALSGRLGRAVLEHHSTGHKVENV